MRWVIKYLVVIFILCLSVSNILAQTKPTPEAALTFLNFYFEGQGLGVVLADAKVCTKVENNECVDTVNLTSVKKDSSYYFTQAN